MKNSIYKNRIINLGLQSDAILMLPETTDERVKEAAINLKEIGFNVADANDFAANREEYREFILHKKFTNNWQDSQIDLFLDNPVNFSMISVAVGHADGLVAGANNKTSDIIRSAIRIIGLRDDVKWISSIFLMIDIKNDNAMTYSDCGVIPEPSSEQLTFIAKEAYDFHRQLTGEKGRIAFLSFSTKGSAEHYKIDKIRKAVDMFAKQNKDIEFEGEIQFDAAYDQSIAKRKIINPRLTGPANIFIFPDLDSGNIAYKITEKLAGHQALGPLLMGFNKPVHDLSRGCSVDDIINIAAITALQKVRENANI